MTVNLTKVRDKHGWSGWAQAGCLYEFSPQDAPMEEVLAALAAKSYESKNDAYTIWNTSWRHRVLGWGYRHQGYLNTPNKPSLWLITIEGNYFDASRHQKSGTDQSSWLSQPDLETLLDCLRLGMEPSQAIMMPVRERLYWKILEETRRHGSPESVANMEKIIERYWATDKEAFM